MTELGFPPLIWTPTTLFEYTDLVHKYTPDPSDAVAHLDDIFIVDRVTITPAKGTIKLEGTIRKFNYHGSLFELFNTLEKYINTLTPPYVYYDTKGMPNLLINGESTVPSIYTRSDTTVTVDDSEVKASDLSYDQYVDLDRLVSRWDAYGGDVNDDRFNYARMTPKYDDANWQRAQQLIDEFNAIPKKQVLIKDGCMNGTQPVDCYKTVYESQEDYNKADEIAREYMAWYNMPKYMNMDYIVTKAGGSTKLAHMLGISLEDILYLYAVNYYGEYWTGQGQPCYCTADTGLTTMGDTIDFDKAYQRLDIDYNGVIYRENGIGFDFDGTNHGYITLYTGFRPYNYDDEPEKQTPRVIIHSWSNLPYYSWATQNITAHVDSYRIQPAYVYQYNDDNFECNQFGYNTFEFPDNEPMIIAHGNVKLHGNTVKYDYINYVVSGTNIEPKDERPSEFTSYTLNFKFTPMLSFNQPQVARGPYITINTSNAYFAPSIKTSDWDNISMKASDGTELVYNRGYGSTTYTFTPGDVFNAANGKKYGTFGQYNCVA